MRIGTLKAQERETLFEDVFAALILLRARLAVL
jgi:hypothetical protein